MKIVCLTPQDLESPLRLPRRVRRDVDRADLVHLELTGGYLLNLVALPRLARRKPTVLTVHDPGFLLRRPEQFPTDLPFNRYLEKLLWRLKQWRLTGCDLELVVATRWMLHQVQGSPLTGRMITHMVPFGLDLNLFHPPANQEALRAELGVEPGRRVVFPWAAPGEPRNQTVMLEALEALSRRVPLCVLTAQNEGRLPFSCAGAQVIQRGPVSDQRELAKLYGAADLFLMLSSQERLGTRAVAALACGVPSVVTQGSALEEVAHSPQASLVVPKGDAQSLQEAMSLLLSDDGLRREMGRRARTLALLHHDLKKHKENMLQVYNQAINKRSANQKLKPDGGEEDARHEKPGPLVSIIIPVYNGGNYLAQAIDSALAQTYPHTEVVVVNDGSNDGGATESICRRYGKAICYFEKENGGVSSALNLAILKARGEYIAWLSHDDMFLPHKIQAQVDELRKLPDEKVVLYSDYELINARGKLIRQVRMGPVVRGKMRYALLRGGVHGCSTLVPKAMFEEIGFFDPNLPSTHDYALWFQAMEGGYRFHHIPQVLILSRWHDEQGSKLMPDHQRDSERLWTWMIEQTSDREKIALEGSLVDFYLEIIPFLQKAGFQETAGYCRHELQRAIGDEIKVSVIIPFYNRLELLWRAVVGVLAQTHENFEVLLVDDGSSEDTAELAELCRQDKRFRLLRQENRGAAAARNLGLENVTGDFVAFLDSDDWWHPDKLTIQLEAMLSNGWACSFHTYYRWENGNRYIKNYASQRHPLELLIIATPTVMVRREVVDDQFRFPEGISAGEDLILWLDTARKHGWQLINQPLASVSVTNGSCSLDRNKALLGSHEVLSFLATLPIDQANVTLQCHLMTDIKRMLLKELAQDGGPLGPTELKALRQTVRWQRLLNNGLINWLYLKIPSRVRHRVKTWVGL